MGIYDREYYRDSSRGAGFFANAPAVKTIILVNVAVFLAELLGENRDANRLVDLLAAHSADVFERGRVWQLVTAPFLHDVHLKFHILFNMFFLWVVGRDMEEMYGSREFSIFYVVAGAFSTLVWALIDYHGERLGLDHHTYMLGASGAVLAVLTLYTLHFPRRELLLFGLVPLEMWLILAMDIGFDFVSLLQQFGGVDVGAVAFAGHLGGAAYGFLYKRFDLRMGRLWSSRPQRPRLRVVLPEPRDRDRDRGASLASGPPRPSQGTGPASARPGVAVVPPEQLEARLDEVLAKIAREGKGGLTDEENRILLEASRRARDKRSDRL
ncbi:MAG TPA: rhomboid family intramembrane serine protease [Isosphaeraceae bacterium]|jgi:membrane associated rhomboid family serine protease|nr:rhomboid family intramembrane serine protease [Isosphaeraceae bacterium]